MNVPHIAAFDPIIRNFIGQDTDLTGEEAQFYYATVMNFDTCSATLLPYMAVMMGVDGFKGFDYAPTEALKRQTLKNAILMKRRHGTKWAIQTALENAGFRYVVINDHLTQFLFDGTWTCDGSQIAYSESWANFTVQMEPPVGVDADDVDVPALFKLINYWKRAVTLCVGLKINQLVILDFGVGFDAPYLFDGEINADGAHNAS